MLLRCVPVTVRYGALMAYGLTIMITFCTIPFQLLSGSVFGTNTIQRFVCNNLTEFSSQCYLEYPITQGESLARGSKLLSIENYVIEIII